MLYSMTGYGKSTISLPSKTITIELKSLNSKFLDINIRMPGVYRPKELEIRKQISNALKRGKVDFSLQLDKTGSDSATLINKPVVQNYMQQLGSIVSAEDTVLLQMAIRMPDALISARDEIDPTEWQSISAEIDTALANICAYRGKEGQVLQQDFQNRALKINELLSLILTMDTDRIENVKQRLRKSITELKEKHDENRFEQELIYYLEKFDITEEKVRLENHLAYFLNTIKSEGSNGKKLGFICQEIGREINTIGSKANYAPMQKLVVQMKDELEKIKEQLLNIL